MSDTALKDKENKFKDTIDLPETDFPMRGNGPVREPEFQAKWLNNKIYEKGLELRKKEGADNFVLHDGPPYLSSDKIHIGTALNKILKDLIIKYKNQRGFYTPYVPGYDSHGLPIETAVVKKIKGGRESVSIPELRQQCTDFALANLKGQEEKFKRLGVLGEWENPYVTLNPKFEAEQIKLFGEMAQKSFIYRGLKTVYWSYGCETALADAEVEYNDEHESTAIYVPFKTKTITNDKLRDALTDAKFVIWTTTPWTIPGNLAICLNEKSNYIVVKATKLIKDKKGEVVDRRDAGKLVVAADLVEAISKDAKLECEALTEAFAGKELEGTICQHPLFDRESPIIFGEHVTTDAGTGCVHTAPGHGYDDFLVGNKFGLGILCPVDTKGRYTSQAGTYSFKDPELLVKLQEKFEALKVEGQTVELTGRHVIKQGNEIILNCLQDAGALLNRRKLIHSYPYCWRSKTPLLYRATEQWFASVDGFREQALAEIDKVQWIPERGRNRIYSMVEDRGDWCISRQRTWGVPIPAFYDQSDKDENGSAKAILDQEIIEHVAKIFAKEGSSAWYSKEVSELIPEHLHSKYNMAELTIEKDTMDVWFDSGSTHKSVVELRSDVLGKLPVDLYLEGSDQHRGWFQSSLLTSVATNGIAPYKSVLTHGFVMDEKGRKMSKSVGNVVDPQKVIDKYGADILRLWVASVDYSVDIKVGDTMFKQLSDIYRNFRNTSRYMLGNLHDFNPGTEMLAYDELWELDKLILHRLQKLIAEITECFDKYQFVRYYQLIQNFCSQDLSAFYFDIIKDRLYTHGKKSKSRLAAQTVMTHLLSALNRMFVPVVPHLAEDIFTFTAEQVKDYFVSSDDSDFFSEHLKSESAENVSVLLSNWPKPKAEFVNEELSQKWDEILKVRDAANKEIEIIRNEKIVGKSLEAAVSIQAPVKTLDLLESVKDELRAVFIISDFRLESGDALLVKAEKFEGIKCVRCWKYFKEEEITSEGICKTCEAAVNA